MGACDLWCADPRPSQSAEGVHPKVQLMQGIASDCTSFETTYADNGFNAVWNADFVFPLNSVEMAILTLTVRDRGAVGEGVVIGLNSVAVSGLRMGYRAVELYQLMGAGQVIPPPTSILCHFELVAKSFYCEDII